MVWATTADCLNFHLKRIIEIWDMYPGKAVYNQTLFWTRNGERYANISFKEFSLGEDGEGVLRISFSKNKGPVVNQTIRLVTTTPHYGGKRCLVLYCALRSDAFVSRKGLGLKYESQKENAHDRAMRRYRVKADQYGAEWGEPWFPKPKGMHIRTHEKRMAELEQLDWLVDQHFLAGASRLLGRQSGSVEDMIRDLEGKLKR